MSEYVEARYAKLVLREARLAEEDLASKLINELLHDLKSFQNLNSARAPAVTSIRQLSRSLDRPQSQIELTSHHPDEKARVGLWHLLRPANCIERCPPSRVTRKTFARTEFF
jgi:hypothetical protein